MNRFFAEKIEDNTAYLFADESHHLARVLRLDPGEKVEITHDGKLYLGTIIDSNKKGASIEIIEKIDVMSEPKVNVTLFQGIPKGSKLDFVVQKCTELGIFSIAPIMTKRCVALACDAKRERLNRIAFESCKQCKRVFVPRVEPTVNINEIDFSRFDLSIVAYEDEDKRGVKEVLSRCDSPSSVAIIIGPEGGFEKEEIDMLCEKGVHCVSLGKRILRSETAGMALLTMVLYEYMEMEA